MDVTSLGSQYLNGRYIPLSNNSTAPGLGGSGGFAELLRKAQTPSPAQTEPPRPVLDKASAINKSDKLYELCMELETFLIKSLIKSMRGTVQKSELIKSGFAGEMYEDMLYDEYAKEYAKNANFGFAEMAYRELSGYSR